MSNSGDRYERFKATAMELADIAHAEGLLHWDQETCMPRRGSEARASSLARWPGWRTTSSRRRTSSSWWRPWTGRA